MSDDSEWINKRRPGKVVISSRFHDRVTRRPMRIASVVTEAGEGIMQASIKNDIVIRKPQKATIK